MVPHGAIKMVKSNDKLSMGAVSSGASLNDNSIVFVKPGRSIDTADATKWKKERVAPFFMVKTTPDQKLANMKLKTSCGMDLAVMVNTRKINPREELLTDLKQKEAPQPLQGVKHVTDDKAEERGGWRRRRG